MTLYPQMRAFLAFCFIGLGVNCWAGHTLAVSVFGIFICAFGACWMSFMLGQKSGLDHVEQAIAAELERDRGGE